MADDLTPALGKNIPLSEMIESLRQEIAVAVANGRDEDIRFEVETAEIEVELVAKRTAEAGAGIKFWVVSAEGKAALTDETTHRLKLTLKPMDNEGGRVKASR